MARATGVDRRRLKREFDSAVQRLLRVLDDMPP
jgi:hypothetical protein